MLSRKRAKGRTPIKWMWNDNCECFSDTLSTNEIGTVLPVPNRLSSHDQTSRAKKAKATRCSIWEIKEQEFSAGYNTYEYYMEFVSLFHLFYFSHSRINRPPLTAQRCCLLKRLRCFCWFLFLLQTLAIKSIIRNCEERDLSSCVHSNSHETEWVMQPKRKMAAIG